MKNRHLFPGLSAFSLFILLSILTISPIVISPLMITVIVLSSFIAGVIYHIAKNTISNEKVIEIALLAFIVQFAAISFL